MLLLLREAVGRGCQTPAAGGRKRRSLLLVGICQPRKQAARHPWRPGGGRGCQEAWLGRAGWLGAPPPAVTPLAGPALAAAQRQALPALPGGWVILAPPGGSAAGRRAPPQSRTEARLAAWPRQAEPSALCGLEFDEPSCTGSACPMMEDLRGCRGCRGARGRWSFRQVRTRPVAPEAPASNVTSR